MKTIFTFLILFANTLLFAQTSSDLDRDNGFMGIQLLADIDTVPDFISIFKDPDADNDKYAFAMYGSQYSYSGSKYVKFGNAAIRKIFLTTAKGYIAEIKVIFEHDSSVVSTLLGMYGKPAVPFKTVFTGDNKAQWCTTMWQDDNVSLIYTAKKYLKKKDSDDSETPDFIYLKYISLDAIELMHPK
jgi:hypothetical protein